MLERPVPPGADSSSGVIALDDFEVGEQTNYSANITPVSDAEFDAIESMFTRMDNFQEYGPFREGTGLKLEGDGTSFSLLKPWENPNFDYNASLVTGTASPVVGNPNAGIWKRLDNTLTGGLFLNNNSVVDQADTEAYSNTSFFGIDGVTHGDVYDASMTTAEYLGYAELGLAVGSLKAFVRNLDADNAKYAADSSSGGPNNVDAGISAGSIRTVNPNYPQSGFTQNCVNCVIATERRFAGDTNAVASSTSGPLPISQITDEFGGSFESVSGMMEIGSTLSRSGNGARGVVFGADHARGFGHVWNVRFDNGTVRFLDSQPSSRAGLGVDNFDDFTDFQFLLTSPGK
ncbi:MAG: toxin glutamine deamidase domain-containing protein [Candidatus Thiodiazotropha endolucinida]